MICIISGPSCAGKSTFIKSDNVELFTKITDSTPTIFPAEIAHHRINISRGNHYLHYNILRPASSSVQNRIKVVNKEPYKYSSDKAWDLVCKMPIEKSAIVLVTTRSALIERMSSRVDLEQIRKDLSKHRYPSSYWLSILAHLDLHKLYLSWCSELKKHGITFTLLNSSGPEYEVINEDQLDSLNLDT